MALCFSSAGPGSWEREQHHLMGLKKNMMKVTPHCATKRHPPGEENGTVRPELEVGGDWGSLSLHLAKGRPLSRLLCFSEPRQEGEKSQKLLTASEEKEPPFPQSLVFGSGQVAERAQWGWMKWPGDSLPIHVVGREKHSDWEIFLFWGEWIRTHETLESLREPFSPCM